MSRIVLNKAQVHRTARNKAYSVMRPMVRQTLTGAKHLAPKGDRKHGSGKIDIRPSLASSWYVEWSQTGRYVTAIIGNRANHASTVADGSKAHEILPVRSPLLAFKWDRANFLRKHKGLKPRDMFYFKRVMHPGRKRPVRFLQTPLAMYGRKYNFKVTVSGPNRTRLP